MPNNPVPDAFWSLPASTIASLSDGDTVTLSPGHTLTATEAKAMFLKQQKTYMDQLAGHYHLAPGDKVDFNISPKIEEPVTKAKVHYESPYTGHGEVTTRLHGTVVRYDGHPVMAYAIEDSHACTDIKIKDLITEKTKRVQTGDPKLDVSSPTLGYVNCPKAGAVYMLRRCDRLFYQGLYLDNIFSIDQDGVSQRGRKLNHAAIGEMLLNKYPKFNEALDVLKGVSKGPQLAWSRHFAFAKIKSVPLVLGRGVGLGIYDIKSNTLLLRRLTSNLPMIATLKQWMTVNVPA